MDLFRVSVCRHIARYNMKEFIEKLIGRLEEKANQTWLVLAERNGYERAIEIVNQLAEEYNNGWIPCSERLPKYGEVVMCSCTNSGITISCITHKGVKPSKSVRFGQHSVIAWQPLQQPYQPKGE